MENPIQLIRQQQLQPGDVIVVRARQGDIVDHYIVFMGYDHWGQPWCIANLEDGVKRLSVADLKQHSLKYRFDRIKRFSGNHYERQQALARAKSKLGTPYNLVSFNCEHFANYVQTGESWSQQVRTVGWGLAGLALFGLALWASGKDDRDNA